MWFSSARKTKRKQLARPGRAKFRPCLEGLEDRCLLSAASLDPTFGSGAGYVTTSLGLGNSAASVLLQPDGKILAAGGETPSTGTGGDFAVTRYNQDGSLDTFFGSGGDAQANFGADGLWGPYAALYPQAGTANDGKIVQEGSDQNNGKILIARFNNNGTLDASFGTGGEVTTAITGQFVYAGGVVVTSTGQIVASVEDHAGHIDLVRYNTDGSLDSTFGQGGEVVTYVAGAGQGGQTGNSKADTLLQQPADGKLIGVVGVSGGSADLIRWNASGNLDTSFGNQGIVTASFGGIVHGAALDPSDGTIVVAGENNSTSTFELARFNSDGSPGSSFGSNGTVVTQISGGINGVSLDASDRIVAVGQNQTGTMDELARFNPDGTPDASFGTGGLESLLATTFGPYGSNPRGVAVYPNAGTANDGKIVMVGGSSRGNGYNSASVARFLAAPSPSFSVTGFPSTTTAGVANSITVTAEDASGNLNPGYLGTVHFTSSDSRAVLPADYTFTTTD